MRKARGAEHQRQRQRDEVDLRRQVRAVLGAWCEDVALGDGFGGRSRNGGLGRAEHLGEVEAELGQHPHRHHRGAADQQDGLDDLHPRRALHAADEDVDDHQHSDDRDDEGLADIAGDVEQQGHQPARARHLGQQIEQAHGKCREGCGEAYRTLLEPEAQHVGHRELACVAQQFGDQEQRDQPGDQEADGVQEAVVSVDGDGAGDAEEAGGRQVVTRDRDAVLRAGERPPGSEELGRGRVLLAGADHDVERDRDEQREDPDVGDGISYGLALGGEDVDAHADVAFQLGADGFGARVEFTVREPDVDEGDQEGGDELAEADQNADVDVAPDLRGHEVMGERAEQHVGEVPEEEDRGHRKDEAAQPVPQFLELWTGLYGDELLTAHRRCGRCGRKVGIGQRGLLTSI